MLRINQPDLVSFVGALVAVVMITFLAPYIAKFAGVFSSMTLADHN